MSEATSDDPIAYFLQDIEYQGKSDRTQDAYERVLRDFEAFLDEYPRIDTLEGTTHRACMAWLHGQRDDVAESTLATYASYLHRFYAYMTQVGEFEENPMALVVEQMDESIDVDPTRRELTVAEMREFVTSIDHPLDRALIVMLLKTGLRVGELCNLDGRDLNLTTDALDPDLPDPRPQLHGKPDSIYVSPDPTRGTAENGEKRAASNKRKRPTVIPVDDELGETLARWLAIRPDPRSSADPLFVSTSDRWGERVTPHMIHHTIEEHAREVGWYRTGGGASENVTPHYFRHFFTTYLRGQTGERGIVKYLRGDVADDVIDTYTHNWGNRVRETYERHIYCLR